MPIRPLTALRLAIEPLQWLFKSIVILGLSLLLSLGLLNLVQGGFQVIAYYWLDKTPHQYPINLEIFFWGIKLIALYLVSIWLLSQYRLSLTHTIIRRSIKTGIVLGVLMISIVAIERIVINYNTNQIACEMPGPTCNPNCN